MSSVLRFSSQNLSRSFVVTQDDNNGEGGAYFFAQSDIDTWYANNEANISKVGRLYTIPSAVFYTVVSDLNYSLPTILQRKTIKDMGTEVVIGNDIVSRLLVLRRVERYFPSSVGGGGTSDVGYVVVENNCTDLAPSNWGRLTVRVARI